MRATTPVLRSMPAQRSSSATASLACSPNSESGARSGVTTVTLHVGLAHLPSLAGGHQRELVGRQRPDRAGRHDDREALRVALLEVAQQAAVGIRVAAREPRRRSLDAGHRPGARSQQQRVEAERAAVGEPHLAGVVVDGLDALEHELGAGVGSEARERHPVGVAEAERLADRERPVGEIGVRRDQRQAGRSPSALCSASSASRPATPPPATTISVTAPPGRARARSARAPPASSAASSAGCARGATRRSAR